MWVAPVVVAWMSCCNGSGVVACRDRVPPCPCPPLPARFQPYACKNGSCFQGTFPVCAAGQWQCD
jgi:hypothetical protein